MPLENWFLTNPFGTGPRTIDTIYLDTTGGTVVDLDGEPTWGTPSDGTQARFVIEGETQASLWELVASNHVDDPANGWKRPLDYQPTQNEKVWKRVTVFGAGGGGGGGTIPATVNLLKGDGFGNAADSGVPIGNVVIKQPTYPTPTTINQVIACLRAAGLCA